MADISFPAEFQQSYLEYTNYPLNAILNGTKYYNSTLESYKARLDKDETDLCLPEEDESYVRVPIRELYAKTGQDTMKRCRYIYN